MFEKIIKYMGQDAKVVCDGKCEKAWGISSRPKIILDEDNEDDYCFLSDSELDIAPIDPGTYEGSDGKPESNTEFPNKWCVRECERCSMSAPDKSHLPLEVDDFSKRIYNIKKG